MITHNNDHTQTTAQDIGLDVEVIEEVIAPGVNLNHNETLEVELTVEEVEEVIAPGFTINHNETLVSD